jgi:hypothetical protein
MPDDSFEQARKAFFVSEETAPKPSVPSAEFLKPRNEARVDISQNRGRVSSPRKVILGPRRFALDAARSRPAGLNVRPAVLLVHLSLLVLPTEVSRLSNRRVARFHRCIRDYVSQAGSIRPT